MASFHLTLFGSNVAVGKRLEGTTTPSLGLHTHPRRSRRKEAEATVGGWARKSAEWAQLQAQPNSAGVLGRGREVLGRVTGLYSRRRSK